MPDREKVMKAWETVLSRDPLDVAWDLIDDTITLLKGQTTSGWVSVKDRMPDKSGPYLVMLENVFVEHLVMNVHYWNAKDGYWRGSEAHSRIVGISHWMPLPEPPEEDADAIHD